MNEEEGAFAWLRELLFLPEQGSTISSSVDHLHYSVILTTLVVSTAIGITALSFMVRYRRRSERDCTPRIVSPLWFEALIIGVPLTFFLVWFAIGFRQFIRIATPPAGSMDVYVTAKQWMWKFAYPRGPNGIDVLRVPAHRPVRLLMTSRDVIHSFYVPSFRIKRDVLPGRYSEAWFEAVAPGRYQVLCAEFCGTSHSLMRAEVVAMPEEEFDAWMASERRGLGERRDTALPGEPSSADMVTEGQKNAVKYECLRCHTLDGTPHIGPTWLGLYGKRERLENGETVLVDEAYLTESMMDPLAQIVAGYKPVMPTFQGRLESPETASIVEFIKSLRAPHLPAGSSGAPAYELLPGRTP